MAYVLVILALCLVQGSWSRTYPEDGSVIEFTDSDVFVPSVIGKPQAWVVKFFASSDEKTPQLVEEFQKAADHNSGIVYFGAIDCDDEDRAGLLCQAFGLKPEALPAIVGFMSEIEPVKGEGAEEGKTNYGKLPRKYEGPGTAASFSKFGLKMIVDRVKLLNDKNADLHLKSAGSKAILFSKKETISDMLKAIASEFSMVTPLPNYGIEIFQASEKENGLVKRFNIKKFPTLIVVPDHGVGEVSVYEGAMKPAEIKDWLSNFAKKRVGGGVKDAKQSEDATAEDTKPKAKKEPELYHVTDQASWEKACPKAGWCFVSFLDPESEEHVQHVKILDEIKTTFPTFRIIWVDGPQNEAFKNQFNVADGYPQATLITRSKLVSRPMRSAFDKELISEFLKISKEGKGKRVMKLDNDPKFEKTDL